MKNKIIVFVFFIVPAMSYSQEIQIEDVIYKKEFQYSTFFYDKTIVADEIDPSKNISLLTNNTKEKFNFFLKCKERKCYSLENTDIIISRDFIIPSSLNIKSFLIEKKIDSKNYLENVLLTQKVLKKKKSYILYDNNFKNVIIVVLKMSKKYYNKYAGNLQLCGNPDDEITIYRILSAIDENILQSS